MFIYSIWLPEENTQKENIPQEKVLLNHVLIRKEADLNIMIKQGNQMEIKIKIRNQATKPTNVIMQARRLINK